MDMNKYIYPLNIFVAKTVTAFFLTVPLLNAAETQKPTTENFQDIQIFLMPSDPSKSSASITEIEMDELRSSRKPVAEKTLAEILAENNRIREQLLSPNQSSFNHQEMPLTKEQTEAFLAAISTKIKDHSAEPPQDPTLSDILEENHKVKQQISILTQILLHHFHEDYEQKKALYEHVACSKEQTDFILSQIREELSKVYGVTQETASAVKKKPDPNFIRRNFQWFKTGTAIGIGTFTGYETYGTATWIVSMLPVYMAPHPLAPLTIGVTVGLTSYLMTVICGKAL